MKKFNDALLRILDEEVVKEKAKKKKKSMIVIKRESKISHLHNNYRALAIKWMKNKA